MGTNCFLKKHQEKVRAFFFFLVQELVPCQWEGLTKLLPNRLIYTLSYLHYTPSDYWKGKGLPDIGIDFLASEKLLDLLFDRGRAS